MPHGSINCLKNNYLTLLFVVTLILSIFSSSNSSANRFSVGIVTANFLQLSNTPIGIKNNSESNSISSAEMETGFFESFELTPDAVTRKSNGKDDDVPAYSGSELSNIEELPNEKTKSRVNNFGIIKTETDKPDSEKNEVSDQEKNITKVGDNTKKENSVKPIAEKILKLKSSSAASVSSPDKSDKSNNLFLQENLDMWQYIVLTFIAIAFVLIILVLFRIYRNTKVIQSPDNIVQQIKSLSNDIESQNKYIKDIKFRIQKTENGFIKVLGHQIDEKYDLLIKDVDMQFQEFSGNHKTSLQQYAELNHKVGEIENLLSSLKEFVAEQKQEIRRLHEGYDWSVISNVSEGLINVIDSIDVELEGIEDKNEIDRLTEIRASVLVLLESHDIKESSPKVGADYKEQNNSSCKVIMIESKEPKMRGKVARVLKPSFVYRISKDKKRVIREAEIEVYN